MSDLIDKALKIAVKAHDGQFDKGGNPYIFHPVWVALHCRSEDERIVALLHDVIEDSDITLDDLSKEEFPKRIIESVDRITRKKGESYCAYINRVAINQIARRVKVQDLFHNSDLSRIPNPNENDIERVKRYEQHASYLMFIDEQNYEDEITDLSERGVFNE